MELRRRLMWIYTLSASMMVMLYAPSSLHIVYAFSPSGTIAARNHQSYAQRRVSTVLHSDHNPTAQSSLPSPNDMRLSEIKTELTEMNISYADCFDKESLVKRLVEARDGSVAPSTQAMKTSTKDTAETEIVPPPSTSAGEQQRTATKETPEAKVNDTPPIGPTIKDSNEEFDRESTLTELRSLRVKELKENLSKLKVRWGTMIEKEEMVQALCSAMEERFNQSKNFSRSGELVPGTVTDVEESTLIKELGWLESDVNRGVATTSEDSSSSPPHPPILLDVYATWCGPCQMVAPLLVEAAEELGPSVRVVKLDSDKYPRISSVLKGTYVCIMCVCVMCTSYLSDNSFNIP